MLPGGRPGRVGKLVFERAAVLLAGQRGRVAFLEEACLLAAQPGDFLPYFGEVDVLAGESGQDLADPTAAAWRSLRCSRSSMPSIASSCWPGKKQRMNTSG